MVFHSKNELPRLFTFKDKISKVFHFDLTYKFKCNIYDNIHGKTVCYIEAKVCEYLGINWEKGKKKPKERAIFYRILHTSLNSRFDDFETLVKKWINEFRLLPWDWHLISRDESSLNKYVKSTPLELST